MWQLPQEKYLSLGLKNTNLGVQPKLPEANELTDIGQHRFFLAVQAPEVNLICWQIYNQPPSSHNIDSATWGCEKYYRLFVFLTTCGMYNW